MNALWDRLNTEIVIDEQYNFIIQAVLFYFVYSSCLLLIFIICDIEPQPSSRTVHINQIFSLLIKAAEEEAIYRFLPLVLAIERWGNSKKVLIVVSIASVVFGLRHGHAANCLLQGVAGFIFSITFLKFGGLNKKYLKAYTASVVTHALVLSSLKFGAIELLIDLVKLIIP